MVNAGIRNGDQIFVAELFQCAQRGYRCGSLIEDSATVKTFYREKGHIRLQPENDTMDPIIVNDCRVLGKVFGVFRIINNDPGEERSRKAHSLPLSGGRG